jgi:hypothetical protein
MTAGAAMSSPPLSPFPQLFPFVGRHRMRRVHARGEPEPIPEHFQPGPARTRPAHGPYWTGLGSDLAACAKNLGPSLARNAIFSYFTL